VDSRAQRVSGVDSEMAVRADTESETTRMMFDWGDGRDRIDPRHCKMAWFGC